jgi:hypothetical protein
MAAAKLRALQRPEGPMTSMCPPSVMSTRFRVYQYDLLHDVLLRFGSHAIRPEVMKMQSLEPLCKKAGDDR